MAADKEEVKVFGVGQSPFVQRAQIALKLKGIEYKYLEEDLENKSDMLLKYNPIHKKVPVIVHNEKPLAESLVILEYIDETWEGYPILPLDPYRRALARFWSKFIDDKCVPVIWKAVWSTEKKEQEKRVEEAFEVLQHLENELKDNKFFGGDTIGMVDIAADFVAFWVPILQRGVGLQLLTFQKFPKLYKWSQEFVNHPVIKQSLPPEEALFGFFKARYESVIASK